MEVVDRTFSLRPPPWQQCVTQPQHELSLRLVPLQLGERHHSRDRWRRWALAAPFALFPFLYFLPWNVIYAGIAAMIAGAMTAVWCRPDLKSKTLAGGGLFLAIYTIFLLGLKWSAPGFIEQVWNLKALSGIVIYDLPLADLPLEELLFGFAFGRFWTGMYEHLTSKRSITA